MTLISWIDGEFYPAVEDNWDNKRFAELLAELIGPENTVLDYGAGRGALPELCFKGVAARVVGVDPDAAVLENPHLDEALILELPNATVPFPNDSFDVVMSNNVLEHLPDPRASLRELYRVLKPGGRLLAKTPNRLHYVPLAASLTPQAFHVYYNRLRGRAERDTFPTHYRCNTRRRVRKLALDLGFSVVELATWESRPEYLRVAAPLYLAGLAFERLVNLSTVFAGLRAVLFIHLEKPGAA